MSLVFLVQIYQLSACITQIYIYIYIYIDYYEERGRTTSSEKNIYSKKI